MSENSSPLVSEFRWASETEAHGMPTPADLEAQGWTRRRQHPRWPATWLMVRPADAVEPQGEPRREEAG